MSPESRRPEEDIIGDLKANINNGIATFTNLALGREGVGYMLRFTAMPHSTKFQIDTPRFSVLPGALKLKIGVQPAVSTAAGLAGRQGERQTKSKKEGEKSAHHYGIKVGF